MGRSACGCGGGGRCVGLGEGRLGGGESKGGPGIGGSGLGIGGGALGGKAGEGGCGGGGEGGYGGVEGGGGGDSGCGGGQGGHVGQPAEPDSTPPVLQQCRELGRCCDINGMAAALFSSPSFGGRSSAASASASAGIAWERHHAGTSARALHTRRALSQITQSHSSPGCASSQGSASACSVSHCTLAAARSAGERTAIEEEENTRTRTTANHISVFAWAAATQRDCAKGRHKSDRARRPPLRGAPLHITPAYVRMQALKKSPKDPHTAARHRSSMERWHGFMARQSTQLSGDAK